MTASELFERLTPIVGPTLYAEYKRRDLCICTTRVVVEVAKHFGIEVVPMPVRAMLYNAAFAKHVENGFADVDVKQWQPLDGSYSVGIGFGGLRPNSWAGHLIARSNGIFGDFSIQQGERVQHGIITGSAIIGPHSGTHWSAVNEHGTTVEYERITDTVFLRAPDWKRIDRRLIGRIIREVKDA